MNGVDPTACEFALSKIRDGNLFEKFAQEYISLILGYKFAPVGGIKDRGIDGLEHIFCRDGFERYIYQTSIEVNSFAKLERTLQTLVDNDISFERICYVTNKEFPEKDKAVDNLYERFKKHIQIFDLPWLTLKVNYSEGTVRCFYVFVESHMHEFSRPGKSYEISDLVGDPRLFVFLRQQWDDEKRDFDLNEILADTLILYCLEGTDPDRGLFKTKDKILEDIRSLIKFDIASLSETVDKRLFFLSKKPRQITYHSAAHAYCLPYETRIRIQEKNLADAALYGKFKKDMKRGLKEYLKVNVADGFGLIEGIVHRLFHQQGLEFADFVIHGQNQQAFEKELPEIVSVVVDESRVIPKNREEVKSALLMTIRNAVYNGTPEINLFLKKLSNTYMMFFLLQCDPKLCTFFTSMASQLNIYVCTSIIVPALSEINLTAANKRHWNLLVGAHRTGANLVINEVILNELAHHFRMLIKRYEEEFRDTEDLYLSDELNLLYVDELMIRAYFYSKMRGQTDSFNSFIDNFVSPGLLKTGDMDRVKNELVEWLKEEFGIRFVSDKKLGIVLKPADISQLYEALKNQKSHPEKAKSDARLILTIYSIREKNNEMDTSGIFGYRTWWLSKDTLTQRTVNEVFKDRFRISCYMRPDFLYNYISLAPSMSEVEEVYREMFPSLLGVNISYHLPGEIVNYVHKKINDHKTKNHARLRGIMRNLVEELKSNPKSRNIKTVKLYLDEELSKVGKERKSKTVNKP